MLVFCWELCGSFGSRCRFFSFSRNFVVEKDAGDGSFCASIKEDARANSCSK